MCGCNKKNRPRSQSFPANRSISNNNRRVIADDQMSAQSLSNPQPLTNKDKRSDDRKRRDIIRKNLGR
jgi:hypothetical protein